jgi:hypothetical protein
MRFSSLQDNAVGRSTNLDLVSMTAFNDTANDIGFAIDETDDITSSGTRTQIATYTIKPNGQIVTTFNSSKYFLEVRGTLNKGQVTLLFNSNNAWATESFDREDTSYPSILR